MKPDIIVLAHNIRSLWNVGSLFRTADCFGVKKLYLTGYTAIPPRREISKTALGADEWISWEQAEDPVAVVKDLRKKGYRIVTLEQNENSVMLSEYRAPEKICLILGHEVLGVSKELLNESDDIVEFAMFGQKESINVAVAAGIALHHFRAGR